MSFEIINEDCLVAMRGMGANTIDSIVTDPPYGLKFMGKGWDHGVPGEEYWAEALRVAKPGAYLLAFGGTRMVHRLAVAIEDAGWEIRDRIHWVYGSGFPKSHNISKAIDKAAGVEREIVGPNIRLGDKKPYDINPTQQGSSWQNTSANKTNSMGDITAPATPAAQQWDGWGTALKPAVEPIIMARKPFKGTVAANVLEWGTGGVNVDGCRVGGETIKTCAKPKGSSFTSVGTGQGFNGCPESSHQGRFPANLIHDGSDEVVGLFPNDAQRFFYQCNEILHRAESMIDVWINDPANTVSSCSSLSKSAVDSVLSGAATSANLGGIASSEWMGHTTNATRIESRRLCVTAMAAILSIAEGFSLASLQTKPTPILGLVRSAETNALTGTTTITISHWKSDGSADPVMFSITPLNMVHGEAVSRFRYCPKANKKDRDGGLGGMADSVNGVGALRDGGRESQPRKNQHPTVKPTDLMAYLCRLVTPPGGIVLDPFAGSGSTGKAAVREGFKFIGCEKEREYAEIATARIGAMI